MALRRRIRRVLRDRRLAAAHRAGSRGGRLRRRPLPVRGAQLPGLAEARRPRPDHWHRCRGGVAGRA